jgi:hypothetical protein
MREIRTSGLTRGRGSPPSLLYRFDFFIIPLLQYSCLFSVFLYSEFYFFLTLLGIGAILQPL